MPLINGGHAVSLQIARFYEGSSDEYRADIEVAATRVHNSEYKLPEYIEPEFFEELFEHCRASAEAMDVPTPDPIPAE